MWAPRAEARDRGRRRRALGEPCSAIRADRAWRVRRRCAGSPSADSPARAAARARAFSADRRSAWTRAGIGPLSPHELAVPAQQGLRRDQQTMAARGRQQTTGRGYQRAVTRSQLRTLDLPTQDLELMAQHEQLDVLDVNVPAAADQQLQQRHEGEVGERHEHHAILPGPHDKPAVKPDQRFGTLQGLSRTRRAGGRTQTSRTAAPTTLQTTTQPPPEPPAALTRRSAAARPQRPARRTRSRRFQPGRVARRSDDLRASCSATTRIISATCRAAAHRQSKKGGPQADRTARHGDCDRVASFRSNTIRTTPSSNPSKCGNGLVIARVPAE